MTVVTWGPRGAPAFNTVAVRLLAWFEENARSFPWRTRHFDDWQLLVTETLLQKTPSERVATVLPALLSDLPGPIEMADAPSELVERHLRPLGLYRVRTRSLKALAREVLKSGEVPSDYDALRRLPGVGAYVASAFLVIARGHQLPTVDANVVRICRRLSSSWPRKAKNLSRRESRMAQQLVRESGDARRLSWALLDFGSLVCRPRAPRCPECVLADLCRYARRKAEVVR